MTGLREAAQMALDAMLNFPDDISDEMFESITALKAALVEDAMQKFTDVNQELQAALGCDHCNQPLYAAVKCRVCGRVTEPVQEPVAWRYKYSDGFWRFSNGSRVNGCDPIESQALYTAPPRRKPLTEEEIDALALVNSYLAFARAIERTHGIK